MGGIRREREAAISASPSPGPLREGIPVHRPGSTASRARLKPNDVGI